MNAKILQIIEQIRLFQFELSFKIQEKTSNSSVSKIKCGNICIFKLSHYFSKTKKCICFIFNDQIQWGKQITHSLHIFNGWVKFTIYIQNSNEYILMYRQSVILQFSPFILISKKVLREPGICLIFHHRLLRQCTTQNQNILRYGTSFSIISYSCSFQIYSLQSIHELITWVLMVQNELKLREF
ncbi:unnamed protein product [Paramecium primaurelia]|uniref:Uncharacterized protein n=1 Tax=Paramecium primaurelia TaxID=5886 RepID=A0A8S1PC13_PARPR|nr:unnamed protein product [Paramecium primaurelia]